MYYDLKDSYSARVKLAELDVSRLISEVREQLFGLVKRRILHKHGFQESPFNLNELAFMSPWEESGIRSVEICQSKGMEAVGYVKAGEFYSKDEFTLDYCCVILCDGTTFESWTPAYKRECTYFYRNAELLGTCHTKWYDSEILGPSREAWELYIGGSYFGSVRRGSHVLFGKLWSRNLVTWNSLRIDSDNRVSLPIHVDSHYKILDFFKIIGRLITLSILWTPRTSIKNDDLCMPIKIEPTENENLSSFYFLVNVVFRTVFFDLYFMSKTGD